MRTGGFPPFRIGGIEVVVDYSWIAMFLAVLLLTESSFAQLYPGYSAPFYWAIGAIVSILVFVFVLVHELARSAAAIKLGQRVTGVRLHIFGGLSHIAPESLSGRTEFLIALAGWSVTVTLGCLCLAVYAYFWVLENVHPLRGVAAYLTAANFILAALHMIPGFPLDGGSVLRAILWDRWNDVGRATRVVSRIGNSLALFCIIFGILQFIVSQSLFSGLLFVVGLFMKQSAVRDGRSGMQRDALANVRVRQVMNENVIAVDWLVSVEELVREYMLKYRLTHFPACDREEVVGMASIDGVKSVPKDLWTFKQVRDIMIPMESMAVTGPESDAAEVLKQMDSVKIECMPVMENGRLAGIVSRHDIAKHVRIKSDLEIP